MVLKVLATTIRKRNKRHDWKVKNKSALILKDDIFWNPKEIDKLLELINLLAGLQDTGPIYKIQLYFLYTSNKQLKVKFKIQYHLQ